MKIALAQINPTVGDLTGNRDKIISFIRGAKEAGAHLVIFPELATTGYPPEDLLLKKRFVKDNIRALDAIRRAVSWITVVVGFVDAEASGKIFNAAAVIEKGRITHIYHKKHLPNYGVFDEKRYFTPGQLPVFFTVGKKRFQVNICEDIWMQSQAEQAEFTLASGDALINLSASPYHRGKQKERAAVLSRRATATRAYVFYVNLAGGQDELVFDGHSTVFDAGGRCVARAGAFREQLLLFDMDRPQPRGAACSYTTDPVEEVYDALILGIKDYVRKNKFSSVLIGLSGGIDSALTAALAVEALGAGQVTSVVMPSQYSSGGTQADAAAIAKNLKTKLLELPIEPIVAAYLAALKSAFKEKRHGLAEENLQARVRGNLLMALSNKFASLVLTTGNKSETSVGYCTLYGDMAGGFAVIKDVPKTLVYELARFANKRFRKIVIPQSVFRRPPSAELKPNQKDTDILPPYSVLDAILAEYVERDASFEEIVRRGFNRKVVQRVITMVDRSEYKRRQGPPGIKITPKAFGRDRRFPITNQYKQF